MTSTREIARGRWRSLLPQFGVSADYLTGKHGPCPLCKDGKDRFRFDDKDGDGTWFCTHCGAGDGARMVMLAQGLEFKEAAREIERAALGAPVEQVKARKTEEQRRAAMNNLWTGARAITPGDPAGRYLAMRCDIAAFPRDLRFLASARYYHEAGRFTEHPALLAMVRDACGKPVNLHRTFLTLEGKKAPYPDARKLMEGELPKGSAVRLGAASERLAVAEGIETALSVTALFGTPCWAAVTADNLAAWTPPEGVKVAPIYGDNDVSFTGQAVAFALARRLTAGRVTAEVHIPHATGTDWNDAHRHAREQSRAA